MVGEAKVVKTEQVGNEELDESQPNTVGEIYHAARSMMRR